MDNTEAVEKLVEALDNYDPDIMGEVYPHTLQAILAAIQADPLAYVKPKPLEWDEPDDGVFEAKGIQDYYEINTLVSGFSLEYSFDPIGEKYGNIYDTLEAAQAAARDDLCKRVKELF